MVNTWRHETNKSDHVNKTRKKLRSDKLEQYKVRVNERIQGASYWLFYGVPSPRRRQSPASLGGHLFVFAHTHSCHVVNAYTTEDDGGYAHILDTVQCHKNMGYGCKRKSLSTFLGNCYFHSYSYCLIESVFTFNEATSELFSMNKQANKKINRYSKTHVLLRLNNNWTYILQINPDVVVILCLLFYEKLQLCVNRD